jgi:hypothetical protein
MEKTLKILILILIIGTLNSFSLNSKEFKLKSKNLRDEKIKMEIQLKGFLFFSFFSRLNLNNKFF